MAEETPDIIVLKFADSKIPEFKEVRNKEFILYGDKNDYPEYLTYLYNKSAKHSAIVNGKSKYIYGGGLRSRSNAKEKIPTINRSGETWNDVAKKAIKDIEIYGGYRLMIIWDVLGRISDIFHIEFYKLRTGKDGGFFYKENWKDSREELVPYEEFNVDNKKGCQIFAYNEYRPGCGVYPLPEYLACNNYIETDIEISKYYLSCIRNGMLPSKMIQFFGGDTTPEKKKDIEKSWEKKFTGAESGGRFILAFSPSKEKAIEITDMSATESDKLFKELNMTCQQEIFTGHQVVSPMLFGIKTEGQLGGTGELKTAYEIFINTYAKSKQEDIEKVVNYFNGLSGKPNDYYIEQLDPIGFQIDMASVINLLPKEYLFEKLNVPKEYWATQPQQAFSKEEQDETAIQLFEACGDSKEDFHLVKSKKVLFNSDNEASEDEITFFKNAFLDVSVTNTEASILDLIKKDKRITPEIIAQTIGTSSEYVTTKIASLIKRGYIETDVQTIGEDEQITRTVTKPISEIKTIQGEPDTTQIYIKYSYEGPKDSRNRPFCAKLMSLNRYYSRYEIEQISQRLGYSVFDRRGGFWTQPGGTVKPYCRHTWRSNVIVKKG